MLQPISSEYIKSNTREYHPRGVKAICPDCGGHNLYYTEDNGLCFCFNCSASYKVNDHQNERAPVKEKDIPAIRAYYGELAEFYHGCIDSETRDYLNHRGIDDNAIQEFSIGYCPTGSLGFYKNPIALDAGVATTSGNPSLADRITLPYIVDGEVSDIRGRATKKEQDPKYKSLFGSSESRGAYYMFNWERASKKARTSKYIIITEGELKALVADRFGFPCVALPGMATWRRVFIPESDWKVIVIFDSSSNAKARREIDHAITRVHERMPTIAVGTLPLLGEDKQDIDSYLLHRNGGKERLQTVVDEAISYDEYRRLRAF